jgi:hypothetical protein
MQLQDALVLLKEGKLMHRDAWKPEDGYLSLMPGMSHVWKIVINPAPNAGNYIFSHEDLLANDWNVYVHPEGHAVVEHVA